jgi:hypothetical protein
MIMKIDENASIKDLQALKRKIERKISSKQSGQEDLAKFYDLIKSDHTKHLRADGRKIFRGVVDYLECYVNGLPPIAKGKFYEKFGIKSKRAKVTPEKVQEIKVLLSQGLTLQLVAEQAGVSTATCQKIKKGDYDS